MACDPARRPADDTLYEYDRGMSEEDFAKKDYRWIAVKT
jgi:hypothetical protein